MPTITCSQFTDEPLAGTAGSTQSWLCVEQPAGWTKDINDHPAGRYANEIASKVGATALFIRKPSTAGQQRQGCTILFNNAHGVYQWRVAKPQELKEFDPNNPPGMKQNTPVALICTHGKRDQCCAVKGRLLAAQLSQTHPGVWECSHTGGHRFAPVMIVLPLRYVYGRLTVKLSREILEGASRGVVVPTGLRGRSGVSVAEQIAEVAVRTHYDIRSLDTLQFTETSPGGGLVPAPVTVHSADGRIFSVEFTSKQVPSRPTSCGKAPQAGTVPAIRSVVQL